MRFGFFFFFFTSIWCFRDFRCLFGLGRVSLSSPMNMCLNGNASVVCFFFAPSTCLNYFLVCMNYDIVISFLYA